MTLGAHAQTSIEQGRGGMGTAQGLSGRLRTCKGQGQGYLTTVCGRPLSLQWCPSCDMQEQQPVQEFMYLEHECVYPILSKRCEIN